MSVVRRQSPVFMAHRDTVLNPDLSPTARLLYVTLVASLDQDGVDLAVCALLVGKLNPQDLTPYLDELQKAGLVDHAQHLGEDGPVLRVNEMPFPQGAGRVHACKACRRCGNCSCFDHRGDVCETCYRVESVRREAKADIDRWQKQLDAGGIYAIGAHSSLLHRWDCKSLNTVERGLAQLDEAEQKNPDGFGYWQRLPTLYTPEEMRAKPTRRRGCQLCKPDPV